MLLWGVNILAHSRLSELCLPCLSGQVFGLAALLALWALNAETVCVLPGRQWPSYFLKFALMGASKNALTGILNKKVREFTLSLPGLLFGNLCHFFVRRDAEQWLPLGNNQAIAFHEHLIDRA